LFFKSDGTVEKTLSATVSKAGFLTIGEQTYADFNGDGVLDTVWRGTDRTVSVALGSVGARGITSFGAWLPIVGAGVTGVSSEDHFILGDVDGDKKADLIWVGAGPGGALTGSVAVQRNTSVGATMSVSDTDTAGVRANLIDSAVGLLQFTDLNGDGRIDLLRENLGQRSVRMGTANGGFAAPFSWEWRTVSGTDQNPNVNLSAALGTASQILGDNRDQTLVGSSWSDVVSGAGGNDVLNGGGGYDQLDGGDGNDTLDGGAGDDWLVGNAGADSLIGGLGSDNYRLSRGDGADRLNNAATDYLATTDRLVLGADVASNQVWLQRSGEDLLVSIMGTTDSSRVLGWYSANTTSRLDSFVAGDGRVMTEARVEALVQAMATMTPPPVGQTGLTTEQQTALNTTIAAAWQ
jgi:Ca2+-binding RTX toxin-like protein